MPMIKLRAAGSAALGLCTVASLGSASAAPAHPGLAAHQIRRIVKMTGYQGMRSHRFDVAGSFRAGGANTVVVRLDGARLGVSLPRLRHDVRLAAGLAANRPTFTRRVKLGRSLHRISYDVAPAGVLSPQEPYVRYVIFTPQREPLAALTRPQRVPPVQALTVIDAAHRLNVTLLQDTARNTTWGRRIPAARLFAMIEGLNTTSYVYVAPQTFERLAKQHVNTGKLVAFGREIWSNSLGFAILSARIGVAYSSYAHQATHMRFGFYRHNHLRYLKVTPAAYRRFARS
jgi:hypothetical protein